MTYRWNAGAAGLALATAGSLAAAAIVSAPAQAPAHAAGAPAAASARPVGPHSELARMGLPQRVGQLMMVGTPATKVSTGARKAISQYHVGSVVLTGRSHAGVAATRRVTNELQSLVSATSTRREPLYVATDQEGGDVQVLQGSGFSRMPKAIDQGGLAASTLKARAKTWAGQLRQAGVNLNLAPVMGTVSASFAPKNKPIGFYGREYGHTPHQVAIKGTAFANGMRAAHLQVAIKHFPGLGRVRNNTDTSSGVRDRVTGRHSTYLDPFKTGIKAGATFVMVSTAYYDKIDARHPAAFSPAIVTGLLRGDLGFGGVVISDDLGAAKQVSAYPPGQRAVDFVKAGGDMILTVKPSTVPAMTHALVARAQKLPGFKSKINKAALRVLEAKHQAGLDPRSGGGCSSKPYPDVATSSAFCGDIAWLKAQHVTGGYGDGGFHPAASVSRQATAAFLHRLAT
jgi:beta-N-acetylhexosaminidase